jgi:hypothetical protein
VCKSATLLVGLLVCNAIRHSRSTDHTTDHERTHMGHGTPHDSLVARAVLRARCCKKSHRASEMIADDDKRVPSAASWRCVWLAAAPLGCVSSMAAQASSFSSVHGSRTWGPSSGAPYRGLSPCRRSARRRSRPPARPHWQLHSGQCAGQATDQWAHQPLKGPLLACFLHNSRASRPPAVDDLTCEDFRERLGLVPRVLAPCQLDARSGLSGSRLPSNTGARLAMLCGPVAGQITPSRRRGSLSQCLSLRPQYWNSVTVCLQSPQRTRSSDKASHPP